MFGGNGGDDGNCGDVEDNDYGGGDFTEDE